MKSKPINLHALYALFATLVFICLPHIERLPVWSLVFISMVIVLKLSLLLRKKIRVSKWIVVLMTIGAVSGILMEYSQLFGRNAGITLLVVMLFLKLLETHSYRDGMLLACMMCFLIITNFLVEQRIFMAAYMMIGVIGITHSFIKLNELKQPSTKPFEWPGYAIKIAVLSVPCMVIFFFAFPRISGPLWKLPVDDKAARSGLSDEMNFGNIGQLALSNEPAFRVEFNGPQPPQRELYWRGIVMEDFDGETWSENKKNIPAPNYQTSGQSYEYTITLEPNNKKWLFALEMPINTTTIVGSQYNQRYQLTNIKEIDKLKRYTLQSKSQYIIDSNLKPESRLINTSLPENINPRSRKFARDLYNSSSDDLEFVLKVLQFFRNEEFYYSLRPALLSGDRVDQFLFSTRKGFCEHYSSSFVFLMRAVGIPARIVTGYQGGEKNALSDYMLVKQADAHAWAEVWLPNRGWQRVDPTAAISPSRIESSVDDALDSAENPRFTLAYNNSALKSIRFFVDSINHNWNQWIVAYDRNKQNQLFKKIGINYKPSNAIIALTILISLAFTIAYVFILNNKSKKKVLMEHQKLYYQFVRLFAKQGLVKYEYENALQFSLRAIQKFPYIKNNIIAVTEIYNTIEYSKQKQPNACHILKQHVEKLSTILK